MIEYLYIKVMMAK